MVYEYLITDAMAYLTVKTLVLGAIHTQGGMHFFDLAKKSVVSIPWLKMYFIFIETLLFCILLCGGTTHVVLCPKGHIYKGHGYNQTQSVQDQVIKSNQVFKNYSY